MQRLFTLFLGAAVLTACREGAAPIAPNADFSSEAASSSPSEYEPVVIELPGDGSGLAVAINNRNQVVAYNRTIKDGFWESSQAFLWENGAVQDLGTLGAPYTVPTDINESGQVVGWSRQDFATDAHAFFWDHGTMQDLGPVFVYGGPQPIFKQVRINDRGQVLGLRPAGQAFLWENGVTQTVPVDFATDLNNRGQVSGWVWHDSAGTRVRRAVVWEAGLVTQIGTLGGSESFANGISNSGWVVGGSRTGPNEFGTQELHAFRWRDGVLEDLGRSGQTSSGRPEGWQAWLVNEPGQIAAKSSDSPFSWDHGVTQYVRCACISWYPMDLNVHGAIVGWGGWVWTDGVLQVFPGAFRTIAINDRGAVVGFGTKPMVWLPVRN